MSDYFLRSQISELEKKVKQAEPVAKRFNDLTSVLAERSGMDAELVIKTLELVTKDSNDLVTSQVKQLLSTARLVYGEELQAFHAAKIAKQREMEEARAKRDKSEAKRKADLDQLHNENTEKADRNTQLYREHVSQFAGRYRNPVLLESISKEDREEIRALTRFSSGKLKLVRCGLLWSKVRLEGESPTPIKGKSLWMYYHDMGKGEQLTPIPYKLFFPHNSYGYSMGYRLVDDTPKYFKQDFE